MFWSSFNTFLNFLASDNHDLEVMSLLLHCFPGPFKVRNLSWISATCCQFSDWLCLCNARTVHYRSCCLSRTQMRPLSLHLLSSLAIPRTPHIFLLFATNTIFTAVHVCESQWAFLVSECQSLLIWHIHLVQIAVLMANIIMKYGQKLKKNHYDCLWINTLTNLVSTAITKNSLCHII